MLRSFEIERFRTFAHLQIKQLGRVNLVVGRNNVGKSMLLEALRLYGSLNPVSVLANLLRKCDEFSVGRVLRRGLSGQGFPEVSSLFHGRQPLVGEAHAITLRSDTSDPSALTLWLVASATHMHGSPPIQVETEQEEALHRSDAHVELLKVRQATGLYSVRAHALTLISGEETAPGVLVAENPPIVPPNEVDRRAVARQWDAVKLLGREDHVKEWVGIVTPIETILDVGDPKDSQTRVFLVRLPGSQPVPLKSLGDGMVRIFHIALALESARSLGARQPEAAEYPASAESAGEGAGVPPRPMDMLLIDEVENGIHYTVLRKVWRFVFEVARRTDVQVFATTHSWDCVEAFQAAAAEDPEADAMLIRLERKGEEHRAVTFSQEDLAIVTRDRIEVR